MELFRIFDHQRDLLTRLHVKDAPLKWPVGYGSKGAVKADDACGQLLSLISRHTDMILCRQEAVIPDQMIYPVCRLRITHSKNSRVFCFSPREDDPFRAVIGIGVVRT